MVRYASADPARLIAFGSVNPRFTDDVKGAVQRVIELGRKALKVHPPHQLFRANAYQDSLPSLARASTSGAQAARIPRHDPHRHVGVSRRAQPLRRSRWTWTTWRSIFRS